MAGQHEAAALRVQRDEACAAVAALQQQLGSMIEETDVETEIARRVRACEDAAAARLAAVEEELRCALQQGAAGVAALQQQLQEAVQAREEAVEEAARRASALAAAHVAAMQARAAHSAANDALVDARAQCAVC